MKPFFSFLTIQKTGGEPHSKERLPVHLLLACLLLFSPMTTMAQNLQDCYDSYDSIFTAYISEEASNTLAICSSGGGVFRIEREGLDSSGADIYFSASADANSCDIGFGEIGFDPEGSYQGILTKPEFSEWKRFLRSECSEVTQPPERIVFVTSGLYSGDLLAEASALEGKGKPFRGESGLEAGDYICQYHAKKGGLQGTYTAWLSDSLEDAKDRVTQGTLPYFRPDGIKVADHFADILDCPSGTFPAEDCLDAVISIDENGEPLPAAVEVWTGTRHTGVSYNADNCDGWTDGTSPKIGRVGSVFYDDEYWTSLQPRSCDKTRHLYCFEN